MLKRAHYIITFAVGIITLFSIVFYSSACKKNKDCKATITVTDAGGLPVAITSVTMAPTQSAPQGNLTIQTQVGTTDGSGSVSFTFKLPAILQASVQSPNPPNAIYNALVQLEEGKTVTKTIKVN
jgi:hypothetical protein